MELVKRGQKFIIIKDFPNPALTSWGKAYTGSEDCTIPKGTLMIAPHSQSKGARAFAVVPINYEEMESKLISQKTLLEKDFGGYYFVFYKDDYGKYFENYVDKENLDSRNFPKILDNSRLNIDGKKIIEHPNENEIQEAILNLDVERNVQKIIPRWLILEKNGWNYIRVWSRAGAFFCMNYKETISPPLSEYYQCKRNFTSEEVAEILFSYFNDTNLWKEKVSWEHEKVD